jgi:hypothetical protein
MAWGVIKHEDNFAFSVPVRKKCKTKFGPQLELQRFLLSSHKAQDGDFRTYEYNILHRIRIYAT